MKRELDPHLFGTEPETNTALTSTRLSRQPYREPHASPEMAMVAQRVTTEIESRAFQQLHQRIAQVEEKLANQSARSEELIRTSTSKFERLGIAVNRFEDTQNRMYQEFKEKYAGLSGKLSERRLTEQKIQEMVDRHNQLVHNFEQRIMQMQKVISEQEFQLANYHATIEEAMRTINRLKRM